ncbi:MAG: Polysaccharide biosynthesis/export protein [Fibrobacteres bacterium]|nr:Polysaccharide biosynthesis/export protein [Fibrobacterota bacterium]
MFDLNDTWLPSRSGRFRIGKALAISALLAISGLSSARADELPTAPHDDRFVAGEAMSITVPLDTGAFLNGGYAVDSAGFVDLPVLGRLQVAGKTRDQVEEYLVGKLSNYLKDTHVRAVPAIRLTLLGFWTHQGQFYISPNTTVWEAVYRAGGIGGDRNLDKVKVMRGEKDLDVSLLNEYSSGRTLAAAGIRSGDIFLIPIPRDNTGGWYWFKEGLTATAQIATVVGTVLTAYITYTVLDRR